MLEPGLTVVDECAGVGLDPWWPGCHLRRPVAFEAPVVVPTALDHPCPLKPLRVSGGVPTTVEFCSEELVWGPGSVSGDLDVGRDRCAHECCERIDVFWSLDNFQVFRCELF